MSENDLNSQPDEVLDVDESKPANPSNGKKKAGSKKKAASKPKPTKARPEFVMISGTVTAEAYYDGYRLHEGDPATVKCPTSDQYPAGRVPTWLKPNR